MFNWILLAMGAGLATAPEAPKPAPAAPRSAVAARQPCAIPLVNVLKPLRGAPVVKPDPMIVVPKGPARQPKEEVQVPAPSCDDVKK